MQKAADVADISVLFFSAGANFWAILAILGHFRAILSHFGSFLGHFLVLIFFGQKFISAIFITFSISGHKSFAFSRRDNTPFCMFTLGPHNMRLIYIFHPTNR